MSKIALVTGCTGQDGVHLCKLLREKKYEVHGLIRRSSVPQPRLKYLEGVILHEGDITDSMSIHRVLDEVCPDEVYNLAAQSHVGTSFKMPEYTHKVNADGFLNLIEAVRQDFPRCRVYQASTSEMFGEVTETPQNENTPFKPISPYAVAKLDAHNTARYYRDHYGMFVSCGILFNHEGEYRGEEFVTQKVVKAAVRISKGLQDKLELGDLTPMRDWGYAKEYVEAMYAMLQDDHPEDYVIATGKSHSVKEFVEKVFKTLNLDYNKYVISTEDNKRPADVVALCGDATKARRELGWWPETNLDQLIKIMIDAELERYEETR
jgi:GDPmannose 4,6-dehydratase